MAKRAKFQIPDFPRDRPTVPEVRPLIELIYAGACKSGHGSVGGCLHVQLDDGNIKTCFWEESPYRPWCDLCKRVAGLMLQMTMTQRRKARSSA